MDAKQAVAIKSQLQHITRAMYSSPPVHGILLVSTILSDPHLKELWKKELKVVTFTSFFFFLSFSIQDGLEDSDLPLTIPTFQGNGKPHS